MRKGWVLGLGGFLRGELLSWAFWKFWGLPTVSAVVSVAIALITGPAGIWAWLAVVACFAVGCVGSAAIEYRSHLRWLRENPAALHAQTRPAPSPLPFKKRGPAPVATVGAHDGQKEGILLVTNTGGDGVFWAEARIVAVSDGVVGHTAPYKLLWRNTTTHKVEREHKHFIAANDTAKLVLASIRHQSMGTRRYLCIVGDAGVVDESYSAGYEGSPTPAVTIEVEIFSEPPLLVPFKRRFTVAQIRGDSPLLVRESPRQ